MKPVIIAENLSKQYRINTGVREAPYTTLRETLAGAVQSPLKMLRRRARRTRTKEEFVWALKDVSFEVQQGEVVGIVGRNGSGKSTLLKVLSRITEPTTGRVELRGRVGSLLEVGTGFHPELTGRENVYLNGAVLGMKRGEIERKFDEIVAFAEIEKFLDTPVKHYSSGMYMRLAFAVAAHLEPEVLMVDEVLAVGDAAFQKKCLGKMQEVGQQGRTVLFVSHNMSAIETLCNRGILLTEGRIVLEGPAAQIAERYLMQAAGPQMRSITFPEDTNLRVQFLRTELIDDVDTQGREIVQLNCEYIVRTKLESVMLCVEVRNAADVSVFYSNDYFLEDHRKRQIGTHTVVLTIPKYLLTPGDYNVTFGFWEPGLPPEHAPSERLTFRRKEIPNRLSAHGLSWPGLLYLPATWHYVEGDSST